MEFKDVYLEFNNCTYYVRQIRPLFQVSELVLVFLHDALGSVDQWKSFPLKLAQQCSLKTVIIDREGYGKSSAKPFQNDLHYLHREAFDVLPNVLELLGIKNPVAVGHSDGATIGLLYSSKFPVSGLVSIAGHVINEPKTIKAIQKTAVNKVKIVKALQKYHGGKAEILFQKWYEAWLDPDFASFNIDQEIKNIEDPLFIIQSREDPYGSLKQVDTILRSVRSNNKASFILEGSAYAPHLKENKQMVFEIKKFINALNISDKH